MAPHRAHHGQEIRPGLHQRRAVRRRDAADGAARQFHQLGPPGQDLRIGLNRHFLGRAGKEGAEGHVIRAVLAGLHRQVAAVLAGHAQRQARSDQLAGLCGGSVLLADMHAVAAGSHDQVGTVVQQEGHAARLRHRAQRVDRTPPGGVGLVLQAELNGGDITAIQRPGKLVGEGQGVEHFRGDQVHPAAIVLFLRLSQRIRPCPGRWR